jgi:hypothetical protein
MQTRAAIGEDTRGCTAEWRDSGKREKLTLSFAWKSGDLGCRWSLRAHGFGQAGRQTAEM